MSACVRACERRCGCMHASTGVVARSTSATSMRSLNTAASARFSFASSFVVSRSAMASLVSSSIVFLRELADVILHLRGDLDGQTCRQAGGRAYGQSGMPAGGRGCQRAGGHMRASRQASMQASGRDSAPARRSEWASRQARGALPPCQLRPARTGQTASCRAGPVRRDGGCSCAGPATRFSRTLRVSCEKVMAAACRRVHVCRSSQCGIAGRRRTAPEHKTRVAAYPSARARLVVVYSIARRECIAASWPCTLRIAMLGVQLAFGAKRLSPTTPVIRGS